MSIVESVEDEKTVLQPMSNVEIAIELAVGPGIVDWSVAVTASTVAILVSARSSVERTIRS